MDKIIHFSIPDFWEKYEVNTELMRLYFEEHNKFSDDISIDSIYGNFPCIWNGARALGGSATGLNIYKIIKHFNDMGLSVRFTCTNKLLTEAHLSDTISNSILQIGENPVNPNVKNGVNISTEVLKDYVQTTYPNYYFVWSTTMGITDINKVNELSEKQLLVLDRTVSKDIDYLKQIKHPENIELLCCEWCSCSPECRQSHYEAINRLILGEMVEDFICPYNDTKPPYYYNIIDKNEFNISIDEIRNIYVPLGFNQFKISGRKESTVNLIERYVNYLVKPEYKDDIRNKLLIYCFGGNI